MSRYFVADDGAGESTIWEEVDGKDPAVLVRRAELPGPHADLLWSVLVGVLTADDDTVERLAHLLWARIAYGAADDQIATEHWKVTRGWYEDHVRTALAALAQGGR